jgi:DNA-binding NarL/FixJ family response regulator
MQYVFCSCDAYLLARWRETGLDAIECPPQTLANTLEADADRLCLLDGLGFETRQIIDVMQSFPRCSFVIAVEVPSPQESVQLLGAGARGYVNRLANSDVLRAALQTVDKGEIWAGADTINYLLARHAPTPAASTVAGADQLLTERELQIALLVLEGLGNKDIARRLDITERTVKTHLNAAFGKTGSKTRLQLALWMGRQGYTPNQVV